MRISYFIARKRLAMIWLPGAGFLFLLLLGMSIFNKFGDKESQAWSWFFPTVMPTLSLMVSSFAETLDEKSRKRLTIDRFLYRMAAVFSIFYLLAVSSAILLSPLVEDSTAPIELMQRSNLWLGPVQGLVSALLGVFFVRKKDVSPKDDRVPPG